MKFQPKGYSSVHGNVFPVGSIPGQTAPLVQITEGSETVPAGFYLASEFFASYEAAAPGAGKPSPTAVQDAASLAAVQLWLSQVPPAGHQGKKHE